MAIRLAVYNMQSSDDMDVNMLIVRGVEIRTTSFSWRGAPPMPRRSQVSTAFSRPLCAYVNRTRRTGNPARSLCDSQS